MIRPAYLLGLLACALLLASALALGRLRTAQATATRSVTQLRAAQAEATELLTLQIQSKRVGEQRRAPEDVLARISDALRQTALGTNRVSNYAEQGDRELSNQSDGPRYRRQFIQFTLAPIELFDIGRFLDYWRTNEPLWTPTNIQITRTQRNRNAEAGYSATIVFAATYVDHTSRSTP